MNAFVTPHSPAFPRRPRPHGFALVAAAAVALLAGCEAPMEGRADMATPEPVAEPSIVIEAEPVAEAAIVAPEPAPAPSPSPKRAAPWGRDRR